MKRPLAPIGLLLLSACRTAATPAQAPAGEEAHVEAASLPTEYPGTLVDIGRVPRDFLMRQKLEGSWQELKFSFEAVIQKQGDKLTVVALTPFGTKAFVLEQTGTQVAFEKFVDREMPFPPEYVLQDINRAFLYDAELPWGVAGAPGGNQAEVHGERVSDRFEDGRLVARGFSRLDGRPAGDVTVDYEGAGMVGGIPPQRVVFRNGWFGYQLTIKTVQYQPL